MPENQPAPWEYCLYIPSDLRAVTVSRRTLRLILTVHGLIRLADTAELLATELVANAVRHANGPAALRVGWTAGVRRLGAWDADPQPPRSRQGRWRNSATRKTAAASHWSGPAPTNGAGSHCPGTAGGGSSCGASSLRLEGSSKVSDGRGARRQEATRRSVTLQPKVSHFCGERPLRRGPAKGRTAHMRRSGLR